VHYVISVIISSEEPTEMEEVGQLRAKLEELCQLLHESQERENLAIEQVRIEVEHLQDELKKLEVEREYAQTKLELEHCQTVERDRCELEKMEKKLLEK